MWDLHTPAVLPFSHEKLGIGKDPFQESQNSCFVFCLPASEQRCELGGSFVDALCKKGVHSTIITGSHFSFSDALLSQSLRYQIPDCFFLSLLFIGLCRIQDLPSLISKSWQSKCLFLLCF